MAKLSLNIERTCKVCGATFRPVTLTSYCCSTKCTKMAWNRKKYEEKQKELMEHLKKLGETSSEFLSVQEVVAIYNVSAHSVYRWIKRGLLPHVIVGRKKIRVKKVDVENLLNPEDVPVSKGPRLYNMEPEACYTIGEICKKFKLCDSSVWAHIRKHSIPTRQIGSFVYVPKEDIDALYL